MWMRSWLLLLASQVDAAREGTKEKGRERLARDMLGNKIAMEVKADGTESEEAEAGEAPGAAAADAADDDVPCPDKMAQCTHRCVLMLEYYITDVASKFEGLDLVSVPETGEDSRNQFYKIATQPLFNEASYLYCGIQRCFESLCKPVCGEHKDGVNPDDLIMTECTKVRDQKNEFFKSQLRKGQLQNMVPMEPVCESVCGRKTEGAWSDAAEPQAGLAGAASLALVGLLLQ